MAGRHSLINVWETLVQQIACCLKHVSNIRGSILNRTLIKEKKKLNVKSDYAAVSCEYSWACR